MSECDHINLVKQVGPLDGGPAKSTRYRCTACGAFVVVAPYSVEVTMGVPDTRSFEEVIQLHIDSSESMRETYQRMDDKHGIALQEGITAGLERAIEVYGNWSKRGAFMAGWDARGERSDE